MHPTIHIRGNIRWNGKQSTVKAWLTKWGLESITTEITDTTVVFDGVMPLGKEGPNGRVKNSLVQDSLEELSQQVEILQAAVRCRPSYPNDEHDIVFLNNQFVEIDLELQPTLEALDDPLIREYYGIDYCVTQI